ATAQHYTWLSRVGRIDMPLTLAVSGTLCAYYASYVRRRETNVWSWPCMLLAYVGAAAAVLLKGPIGFVLPAVVIAAHLLVERLVLPARSASEGSLRPSWLNLLHQLGLWWGLPLVIALTAPLFWWLNAQTNGAFGRVFFWYHNFERGF